MLLPEENWASSITKRSVSLGKIVGLGKRDIIDYAVSSLWPVFPDTGPKKFGASKA